MEEVKREGLVEDSLDLVMLEVQRADLVEVEAEVELGVQEEDLEEECSVAEDLVV